MSLILLHGDDDVAVATSTIAAGSLERLPGTVIVVRQDVQAGHKVAVRDLSLDSVVRKYGHIIGVMTEPAAIGSHVHTHNLAMSHDPSISDPAGSQPTPPATDPESSSDLRRTFLGIRRPNGSVATRNYIGVLTTVNCSASVARQVVRRVEDRLPAGVDGVVALTHGTGCGMADAGDGWDVLRRTLVGYARHPNFGALVVVGLGCEVNTIDRLVDEIDID